MVNRSGEIAAMVVPAGILVPVINWRKEIAALAAVVNVTVGLLIVVDPTLVHVKVKVLEAAADVGVADKVICVPLIAVTVVKAGIPVPVTVIPTEIPKVLALLQFFMTTFGLVVRVVPVAIVAFSRINAYPSPRVSNAWFVEAIKTPPA